MSDFPQPVKGPELDDMIFGLFGRALCIGATTDVMGLGRGSTLANITEGMAALGAGEAVIDGKFDGPRPPKPAPRMSI